MTPICHGDDALRFIPIAKNASTSIISAMFKLDGTPETIHRTKPQREPWREDDPRPTFAVIRPPAERFSSAWRNKVYRPGHAGTKLLRDPDIGLGMPFPDFLSLVEQRGVRDFDPHILPQVDYLPPGYPSLVHLLPMHLLTVAWSAAGLHRRYGDLGMLNESDADDVSYKYWDRIEALYPDDLSIYNVVMWGAYPLLAEQLADRLR